MIGPAKLRRLGRLKQVGNDRRRLRLEGENLSRLILVVFVSSDGTWLRA